ncbi:hypothetical protein [Vibrio viridaestus]|uniref:Cation transporter n=1 Tax=Vibrio viridaestus TaxID=2487322 RepID=A0A3N9TER2_9VIBR|nr:hypothetical protein [Vibrio viridaestus]RQW62609.1 hypothetical protein EES38_12855 [Vibrio viridaestus]
MSEYNHRVGVREKFLVKRRLKIDQRNSGEEGVQSAIEALDVMFGLDDVSYVMKKQTIEVAYDVGHLSLAEIRQTLSEQAVKENRGLLNRIRLSYYQYLDQNIRDNMAQEPWSCHMSSPSGNKKGR